MKPPKQKINKLYYNKYPYKIACKSTYAYMLSNNDIQAVRRWATNASSSSLPRIERMNFLSFLDKVEPFLTSDIKIRIERNHFNLFCMTPTIRNKIKKALNNWVVEVCGPENKEELAFLLANSNKKIICNLLPYNRYQFKVFIKSKIPENIKEDFLNWSKKYDGSIRMTDSTESWFLNYHRWAQAPFIYVEDSKTLTMVSLFLGGNIKKIEEHIVREGINISS